MLNIIIREMQFQTTMRYHLTSVRMTHQKKKITNVGEDMEKSDELYAVSGHEN